MTREGARLTHLVGGLDRPALILTVRVADGRSAAEAPAIDRTDDLGTAH